MFTNTMAWPATPYQPDLPPPLCFTTPAGDRAPDGPLVRSGVPAVTLRAPKLMMDPSDETTWQRPYRFTR